MLSFTLQQKKRDIIKARDIHNEDAIMIAIKKKDKQTLKYQEEIVQFLIRKDADINCRVVNSDILPMELAVKSGHTNILKILQKEPKLDWDQFQKNQKDSNGNLMHYAVRSGKIEMIKKIREILSEKNLQLFEKNLRGQEYENGNTPLHEACDTNSKLAVPDIKEMVKMYKGQKIPLQQLRNYKIQTPLHIAAECGRENYVQSLLSEKGNEKLLNSEDQHGNRALHTAAEYKNDEVFALLLDKSSNHENHKILNKLGKSPLHVIVESGSHECLNIWDVHIQNKFKSEYEMEMEKSVNSRDFQGNTPLHLASRKGHVQIVGRLLKLGANALIKDHEGRNALQVAIESQDEEMVKNMVNAFLESKNWKDLFRVGFICKYQNILDTPMRQLIRNFPDVAEIVLDKCKEEQPRVESQNKLKNHINEFLEDTYKYKYSLENNDACYIHVTKDKEAKKNSRGEYYAEPYTRDGDEFFENHPLMTINKYKQQKLLMHDVTKNLINTKWKLFGNQVYFYNLGFYCCFLAVLTTNVMTSIWPQKYPALFSCSPYFEKIVFNKPNQTYVLPDHVLTRRSFNYVSRAFIWGFVILRLVSIAIGYELSILLKVCTI